MHLEGAVPRLGRAVEEDEGGDGEERRAERRGLGDAFRLPRLALYRRALRLLIV